MHLRPALLVTLGLALGGCASTIDTLPFPPHGSSHLIKGEASSLVMFNEDIPSDVQAAAKALQSNADIEAMARACAKAAASPGPQMQAFAAPALALALVPMALDFVGSQVKKSIDEFASTYEATWSARYIGDFYRHPLQLDGNGRAIPENNCFSLVRKVDTGQGAGQPVFLLIGKFEPSADGFAVRVRPLFQSYAGTKARVGSDGRFNAAITLTVESVWGDRKSGVTAVSGKVFTATMALGQLDLDTPGPGEIPAVAGKALASTWFPYIPISRSDNQPLFGSGPFTLTATVTETALARDLVGSMAATAGSLVDKAVAEAKDRIKP